MAKFWPTTGSQSCFFPLLQAHRSAHLVKQGPTRAQKVFMLLFSCVSEKRSNLFDQWVAVQAQATGQMWDIFEDVIYNLVTNVGHI